MDPLVYDSVSIRAFDSREITENIHSSWYTAQKETYSPLETAAEPDMDKAGGYSWVKARVWREAV